MKCSFPDRPAFLASIIGFLITHGLWADGGEGWSSYVMEDPEGMTIPTEWIDEATGHRVRRLSRGGGQYRSFYFHNRPFFTNESGESMMVFNGSKPGDEQGFVPTTQQYWQGPSSNSIYTVNLRTGEVRHLAEAPRSEILGCKSRSVYFQAGDEVIAIDLISAQRRTVAKLPEGDFPVHLSALNADETRMAGVVTEDPTPESVTVATTKGERMQRTFDAKQMRRLVALDLESGELETLLRQRVWFGHLQFSPVDPDLLMYCHEGPWHLLDRVWTYRIGSGAEDGRKMFGRSVDREIWGHEWWDPSGDVIWFDHQVPLGSRFFLTGVAVDSLKSKRYELERDEWSVHFTMSPDRTLFAGDGGSPGMVAKASDGRWIYLFRPNDETGRLESSRLVDMKDHDYSLEPNVHFTPDRKWIVFRSNMHGPSHVYAVEIQ